MGGDRHQLALCVVASLWAAVCVPSSVPLAVRELLSHLLLSATPVSHPKWGGMRSAL